MNRFILVCLVCCFSFQNLSAQDTRSEWALYNMGFGAVTSGIGALINKRPEQKWHKVLLKGMGQGALGGYVVYQSKNLLSSVNIKQQWQYSWYAKIVNSAGTSIIENASLNRNFWEQWNINIGFNRFEFHTKEKFKFKYKIMPVSLLVTAALAIGNKFEIERSLQLGEFIFSNYKRPSGSTRGRAFATTLLIRDQFIDSYDLYSHEITHIYQYYDFNVFNSYINKPKARWTQNSKTYSKFNELFYFDAQGLVLYPAYFIQNDDSNFFEKEADFYQGDL